LEAAALGWMWPLRKRPWLGTLVGLVAVLAALTPFAVIDPTPFFGMPGSLASAITIFIAIAAGLLPALITAAVGGGFFVVYVANAPHPLSGPAAVATAVIWVAVAAAAGYSADQLWRRLADSFAELRAHELQVRGTLESAAAAVGVFRGPDLRCEDANARLRELFTGADWQGVPLTELMPGLPTDLVRRFDECVRGEVPMLALDELDLGTDGRTFSLTGHCEAEAAEPVFFLTLADVTSSVQARRQLEQVLSLFGKIAITATPAEVAAELCRAAIVLFGASTASFWTVEEDEVTLLARAPALVFPDRWRLDEMADLADVVRSAVPLFVRDVHEHYSPSEEEAADGKLQAFFKERRYRALLCLPVVYGPKTGALFFLAWDDAIEQPGEEMLTVARRFADEAAIAIERAERLAAQQEAARLHRRLETSLLPKMISSERVEVSYRYIPGQRHLLIGGDFLDVAELPGGVLALIIGDVSGHGPDAAALGAALRASWHALTLQGVPPNELLRRLDQLLASERSDPAEFATACVAWIDAGHRELRLSLAGHPAPLLMGEAGVAEVTGRHGAALGIGAKLAWPLVTVPLPAPWDLLFYTDGLIDSFATSNGRRRLGLAGLLGLVNEMCAGGSGAAGNGEAGLRRFREPQLDELLRRIAEGAGRPSQDDVALLLASSKE
jgi:serine phosphatase RsbU (regulator of sigma subunit)